MTDLYSLAIWIPGTPRPQPRARSCRVGAGSRMYTPKTAQDWRTRIAAYCMQHRPPEPLTGPVSVSCTWLMPRPRGHYGTGRNAGKLKTSAPAWHTKGRGACNGDRDNLDKAVLDTLTELGFWLDDGQVCDGRLRKIYPPALASPGMILRVAELKDTDRCVLSGEELHVLPHQWFFNGIEDVDPVNGI